MGRRVGGDTRSRSEAEACKITGFPVAARARAADTDLPIGIPVNEPLEFSAWPLQRRAYRILVGARRYDERIGPEPGPDPGATTADPVPVPEPDPKPRSGPGGRPEPLPRKCCEAPAGGRSADQRGEIRRSDDQDPRGRTGAR